jgi:hypothetical protein
LRFAWFSLLALSILAATTAPAPGQTPGALFNQDPHQSRGFGTEAARVDSQITLRIPQNRAAEVYAYLRRVYADGDEKLRAQFPDLRLRAEKKIDVSEFTDVYFDTPELGLFGTQNTIRHRSRVNTTNPDDRKSGRQLVQIKSTPSGRFDLRTELKFEVNPSQKFNDATDAHPLFRLVDRSQREDLQDAIRKMGVPPFTLRPSITIRQIRSRVYIYWDNKNILSFSVDEYRSRILWASAEASSVDVGLVENVYTEASETQRRQLWAIRDFMVTDLRKAFPDLEQNSTEKYSIILSQLLEKVPGLRFLIRHNLL